VKTTSGKGVTKLRVKNIVCYFFFCENGLERTTKTIPVGIFADLTFFTPFRGLKVGGEMFLFNFFRENGSQWTTKTISAGIFCCHNIFSPLFGGCNLGVKCFIRFFVRENSQEEST